MDHEMFDQFCRIELAPYVRQLLVSQIADLGSKCRVLNLNMFDVELNGREERATVFSILEPGRQATISLDELVRTVGASEGAAEPAPSFPKPDTAVIWEVDASGSAVCLMHAPVSDSQKGAVG